MSLILMMMVGQLGLVILKSNITQKTFLIHKTQLDICLHHHISQRKKSLNTLSKTNSILIKLSLAYQAAVISKAIIPIASESIRLSILKMARTIEKIQTIQIKSSDFLSTTNLLTCKTGVLPVKTILFSKALKRKPHRNPLLAGFPKFIMWKTKKKPIVKIHFYWEGKILTNNASLQGKTSGILKGKYDGKLL